MITVIERGYTQPHRASSELEEYGETWLVAPD